MGGSTETKKKVKGNCGYRFMSKKERDHYILKFHGLWIHDWIRVYETYDSITFKRRHTGKRITLRY